MTATAAAAPADVFASLLEARQDTAARDAERAFLVGVPIRLSIAGALIVYGVASGKAWARWAGGLSLAWTGVEYFAARRQTALAPPAPAPFIVPQGGLTG